MSHAAIIQPQHLQRTAIVYVRQSTAQQLLRHQESTHRQYELAQRAAALGWPPSQIVIIDEDQGHSGTSSTHRFGFQRLVTAITLGEVGLVLVTEVSRLSRLNSDWHRVLEVCAVFGTLLADDEGVYDPQDPGDQLVLGLKGTLFAAELHLLQARMRQALLHKAQRGALALRLPVGYRRLPDGSVVFDPDDQVRETIARIFTQFAQVQNARAVQRAFQRDELLLPRVVQSGLDAGRVVWVRPTYQMFQQVLTSPVYAGIFVYGRRIQQTTPGDPPHTLLHRLPHERWAIVVPGVYPAYLSEEQYYANRETLRRNLYNFALRRPGAPREGPALLQGLVLCGRCGRRMTVSYGSDYAAYVCRRDKATYAVPQCQSFPRAYLDEAIRDLVLAAMAPAELETLLGALAALEQERQQAARQWQLRRERARYVARLAERQYDACDPENRLVARALEQRWNDALAAHEALERAYAAACRTTLAPLDATEQQAMRQLAADLPALWDAPTTTSTDRKRWLRLVLQEVTVLVQPGPPRQAALTLRWSGGQVTHSTVTCRPPGWHGLTPQAVLARLRALAPCLPDHQIAAQLNAEDRPTATGKRWTAQRVAAIRKQHGIRTGCPVDPAGEERRGDGLLSVHGAAQVLQVSTALIHVWVAHGVLAGDQRVPGSYRWVRLSEEDRQRLQGEAACTHWPRLREVARARGCTAEAVWDLVRAGAYVPYRRRVGRRWEWRLQPQDAAGGPAAATAVTGSKSA